jgi:hypothetical protein
MAEPLVDTAFITLRAPWSVGLSFLGLEVTVIACGVLTLLQALAERRLRGDAVPLFTWAVSFTYGIAMELASYNFVDSFHHGQFSVMFYRHQLPLYVVTLYPVLQYTSIIAARRLRAGIVPQMLLAGLLIVAMDVPFDILGPVNGWWSWSATDPNVAYRWYGVPVTSYYWHFAWGGILAGLTRAFGRYVNYPHGPLYTVLLAPPVALLTMVLGVVSFIPFHVLKARGVADGTIVACALLAGLLAVMVSRRPANDITLPVHDRPLFIAIPLLHYAYHLIAALAQLASGTPFIGQMAVIASVATFALVAYRFAYRWGAPGGATIRLQVG